MQRIFDIYTKKRTFFRGSGILAFTTVLAYAMGLLRDRLLAHAFGAGSALSAYEAAFVVPDLILNIFVAAALSSAFVPIFSDVLNSGSRDDSDTFVSSVLNGSLLVVLVAGIVAFIFAPQISHAIVPGFDQAARHTYIMLLRLLLLSPILFAISNTMGSILVTQERFFWYGMASPLYNFGTVIGIVFLGARWGIMGVAVGTLLGAVFHLSARLIGIMRHGFSYRFTLRWSDYYRRFLRLMAPKMFGQPVDQLTAFGFTAIASTISAGSIVVFNFAQNFQSMPISVIGITLATTAFPALARAGSQRDSKEFWHQISFTVKTILIIAIPSAIAMYLLRHFIIGLIFGGGEFSAEAVNATAATLGVFTLSIVTESITQLLARAFYSLKNSITPVVIALVGLGIAIGSGYLFSRTMGVPGLALGFFIGSLMKVIVLSILLKFEAQKKLQN
ncbi:MAG: murein biosynthesis integral membrane protein MurJ [Candidatus Yanofskybacteria bacterium RIFCSPLOWO2_01_FULL_49_25]|uniref:Murein biosynthesis integral membrane protein MurJ n=1 Tax=Candidatus Yanofskybacteria bacterium RIFCSPLOWO2_01_FULL_49_25 TaxID=1802701 RepID=A0A1F8GWZ1_9BACT|nr:MAG: murein biosynthesis integral membrane protein MurJ [Candidatus Yanofskybacteria bacterium RIFCSPLOWO2_01_FULL_49_25]